MYPSAAMLIMAAVASTMLGSGEAFDLSRLSSSLPGPLRLLKAVFLAFLCLYSGLMIISNRNCIRNTGAANLWLLLYALMAIVSATYSVNFMVSAWKGFEVLSVVMFGMALAGNQRNIEDVRWLLDIISLISLFLVFTVLSGAVFYPHNAFKYGLSTGGGGFFGLRGLAPIMNPATQGAVAGLAAAAILVPILGRHIKPLRDKLTITVIMLAAVVIAMLLLSRARTNIFAFAIALSLILFYSRRIALAATSIIVGLIAFLTSDAAINFIYRGQTKEQFISLTGRTQYWKILVEEFSDSPMLGKGFYAAMRVLFNTNSVDNSYLEAYVGLGFIGLFLLTIPIIVASYTLFITRPRKGKWTILDTVWVQVMAFFSFVILRSFTSPTFASLHPMMIFYIVILVSIASIRRLREQKHDDVESPQNLDSNDIQRRILSRTSTNRAGTGHSNKRGAAHLHSHSTSPFT